MHRTTMFRSMVYIVTVVFAFAIHASSAWCQTAYHLTKTIKIGGEGGWDYLTFEPRTHRLFVSHSDRVEVIDAVAGTVIGEISKTEGVHGIALDSDNGRGYISCGRPGTVVVFDLKTLKAVTEVPVGKRPDAILYDPFSHDVFVFNGGSQDVSVIDPAENKVAGTIPLGGKPEFGVSDSKGHVYVNIEDKSEVAAIDVRALKVDARWSIAPGEEPSGLAIDREHERLFSVCGNKLMVVSDAVKKNVITSLPIGGGVDGCAFDPQLGYAFASNGEGTMTVVAEKSPESFAVVETDTTQRGARTITLDPESHSVYLPTAEFGSAPAQGPNSPRQRPSIKPQSFIVLV